MEHISKYLPEAINPKNSELQKHESKHLLNGDESNFSLAITSPKILDVPQESVKEVLRLIFVKVGLRAKNFPSEIEKEVLINHIIENYGKHSLAEIRLAFDLAVTGKLDLEDDEVNCYENFSCAYFSRIMVAYRNWASEAIRKIPAPKPEPIVYTTEQLMNQQRQVTQECYERFLNGDVHYFPKRLIFSILSSDRLLLEGETVEHLFERYRITGRKSIYVRESV